MWTGKSRCVCWCWFCLTYFYPRRYLTQWKLLRDCDQDPHGTPEDTIWRHEHRQEHENKWSYQHLSGGKHVPYREERQGRQAFRLTHTHARTHTHTLSLSYRPLPYVNFDTKGFLCQTFIIHTFCSLTILYFQRSDTVSFHWTLEYITLYWQHLFCRNILTIRIIFNLLNI